MKRTWRIAVAALIALGTLSTAACLDVELQEVDLQDKVPDPSTEPHFKSSCPAGYTLAGTVEVECDNFSVSSATLVSLVGDWRDGKCHVTCRCSGSSEDPPADEICSYPNVMADSTFGHRCPAAWSSAGQVVVSGLIGQECSSSDSNLGAKEQACDNHCANLPPFSETFTCCRPTGTDAGTRDGGVRDGGVRDGGVRDGGVRDGGAGPG